MVTLRNQAFWCSGLFHVGFARRARRKTSCTMSSASVPLLVRRNARRYTISAYASNSASALSAGIGTLGLASCSITVKYLSLPPITLRFLAGGCSGGRNFFTVPLVNHGIGRKIIIAQGVVFGIVTRLQEIYTSLALTNISGNATLKCKADINNSLRCL